MTVNARPALILNRVAGVTIAVLDGKRRRFTEVAPETWRQHFLGYGRKKGFKPPDYKRAAKSQCELLGIPARNQDQADAAGIADWAAAEFKRIRMHEEARAA